MPAIIELSDWVRPRSYESSMIGELGNYLRAEFSNHITATLEFRFQTNENAEEIRNFFIPNTFTRTLNSRHEGRLIYFGSTCVGNAVGRAMEIDHETARIFSFRDSVEYPTRAQTVTAEIQIFLDADRVGPLDTLEFCIGKRGDELCLLCRSGSIDFPDDFPEDVNEYLAEFNREVEHGLDEDIREQIYGPEPVTEDDLVSPFGDMVPDVEIQEPIPPRRRRRRDFPQLPGVQQVDEYPVYVQRRFDLPAEAPDGQLVYVAEDNAIYAYVYAERRWFEVNRCGHGEQHWRG